MNDTRVMLSLPGAGLFQQAASSEGSPTAAASITAACSEPTCCYSQRWGLKHCTTGEFINKSSLRLQFRRENVQCFTAVWRCQQFSYRSWWCRLCSRCIRKCPPCDSMPTLLASFLSQVSVKPRGPAAVAAVAELQERTTALKALRAQEKQVSECRSANFVNWRPYCIDAIYVLWTMLQAGE
jgi:hypothetical protein